MEADTVEGDPGQLDTRQWWDTALRPGDCRKVERHLQVMLRGTVASRTHVRQCRADTLMQDAAAGLVSPLVQEPVRMRVLLPHRRNTVLYYPCFSYV